MSFQEINFDGETIYIDINSVNGPNGAGKYCYKSEDFKDAIQPIAKAAKVVIDGMKDAMPDEVELGIQLSAHIDNGKLLIGIVNVGADATYSMKLTWKNKH